MKRKLISVLLIFAAVMTVTSCKKESGEVKYNEDPDLSSKIVASDSDRPQSLDELTVNAEVIVVVNVLDDGETPYTDIYGNNIEIEDSKLLTTYTNVEVVESVYGDLKEGDNICLWQFGMPGENDHQTKVRKGERLLLILNKTDDGTYISANLEHGMFYLDEKNTVTSMSDALICARYDGLIKDVLVKDLLEAMKNRPADSDEIFDDHAELEFAQDKCISAEITGYVLKTLTEFGYRDEYEGTEISEDYGPRKMVMKRAADDALYNGKLCPRVGEEIELIFPEKIPSYVTLYTGFVNTDTNVMIDEYQTSEVVVPDKETMTISLGADVAAADIVSVPEISDETDMNDLIHKLASSQVQAYQIYDHYRYIRIVCDFDGKLVEYSFFPGNDARYLRFELQNKFDDKLISETDYFAGRYVDEDDKCNINLANNGSSGMSDEELIGYYKGIIGNIYGDDVKYHMVKYTFNQLTETQKKLFIYWNKFGITESYLDIQNNKVIVGYADDGRFDRDKVNSLVADPDMLIYSISEGAMIG